MRKALKIIGLTGGIGSGKSTVARMFMELGVPVYFSDDEAKKLMLMSPSLRSGIIKQFGNKAYDEKGLNKSYLAQIVFNDPKRLQKLNELVHPEVEKDFRKWANRQTTAYVIQENPLLFENNKQDQYDKVMVVSAPIETRIDRVKFRDGATRSEVEARIRNQMDERYKVQHADYVIENTGDLKSCRNAVKTIHQTILSEIP